MLFEAVVREYDKSFGSRYGPEVFDKEGVLGLLGAVASMALGFMAGSILARSSLRTHGRFRMSTDESRDPSPDLQPTVTHRSFSELSGSSHARWQAEQKRADSIRRQELAASRKVQVVEPVFATARHGCTDGVPTAESPTHRSWRDGGSVDQHCEGAGLTAGGGRFQGELAGRTAMNDELPNGGEQILGIFGMFCVSVLVVLTLNIAWLLDPVDGLYPLQGVPRLRPVCIW